MKVKPTKVLFLGTPDFAVGSLKAILEAGYDVCAVVTTVDKPAGRGQKARQSAVKKFALENELTVLQPESLKRKSFLNKIREMDPDFAVVVAFRMMPKLLWSIPKFGTFNLHASLLPQYRGAAPINWAIMNGEKESGVSTFFIDEKIDTGFLLLQERCPIPMDWTAGTLHDHLMDIGARLVVNTLNGLSEGSIPPRLQEESSELKDAPKLDRNICRINWELSSENVINHIRGLSPYPSAWTMDEKNKVVKVYMAKPYELQSMTLTAGQWCISEEKSWLCGTGDQIIEITELQLEGKKRMKVSDFINGFRLTSGTFN